MKQEPMYYIATTAHESLWPQKHKWHKGVILWWAAGSQGYSSTLDRAGKYPESVARHIVSHPRAEDFMVPCEVAEAMSARVVDLDKLNELKAGTR